MNPQKQWIAYKTIVRKELIRIFRIWPQTLLPSVITVSLYYVIFGQFIGSQIASIHGFTYMQFIVPGLIMMNVITNSFMNTVSSFYSQKFQRNLEELMVSPTPHGVIIAGFITGGIIRGLATGLLVLIVALFFTKLTLHSLAIVSLFVLLTASLFSLAGLINGIFAKNFDGISIFPTFVLTPLTYLGGVFYSIALLSPFWQALSKINPILYMVNGFRFGFLGISDVSVTFSIFILVCFNIVLLAYTLYLFKRGRGLRT